VSQLRNWAEGVWVAEAPLRFYGVPFGTRMTVVRIADGGLLLHSPIPLSAALRDEIDALGEVRHAVSPNKLHHLYLGEVRESYPNVRVHAPPGLARKRSDLDFDDQLTDTAAPAWAGTLEQVVVRGSRVMQEVVFFHPESATLLVADLCEHFGAWSPPLARWLTRLARMYDRPRMPPDWQLSFRNREKTRTSFERIMAWEFDRVILAHGALLESGAKAIFAREYDWALR
jgi:hypothetical protein